MVGGWGTFSRKVGGHAGRGEGGPMNENLQAALEARDAGLCPIPIRPGKKTPLISWRQFQKRRPTENEIEK